MKKGEKYNDHLYNYGRPSYIGPLFFFAVYLAEGRIDMQEDREWERTIVEMTGALPSEVWQ